MIPERRELVWGFRELIWFIQLKRTYGQLESFVNIPDPVCIPVFPGPSGHASPVLEIIIWQSILQEGK